MHNENNNQADHHDSDGHVHGPHCNHGPQLEPIKREQPKIGRNDPCHCGSGKKHKKCCAK